MTVEYTDPAGHGAGRVGYFVVLFRPIRGRARRFIKATSAVRESTRTADYGDVCDDRCR
jgi:hypothetical protein